MATHTEGGNPTVVREYDLVNLTDCPIILVQCPPIYLVQLLTTHM